MISRTHLIPAAGLLLCCAHDLRRFPTTPILWDDAEDRRAFSDEPEEYFSPFWWDGADQMVFRPLTRVLAVDLKKESVNVNAMDEVPDSSWYVNRLSRRPIGTEELLRAACKDEPLNPNERWSIVSAKPNGANPGFIVEDARGRRFLIKFDSRVQPERGTSADVMGSILYWGAGYHTPCNRIVFFDRDNLDIEEGVVTKIRTRNGLIEAPLTWELLNPIFEKQETLRLADGRYRAAASQFIEGKPIGPWRYEGTWDDDPNDVIPHEERRELRGVYVLAAWINHFDSREQNTLAAWMTAGENKGYVRHYYIDFGDSFGSHWPIEGISRRLGHSGYLDLAHIMTDFMTFGLVPRAWNNAAYGPAGQRLGYYDVRRFEPDDWHPGYPNPAFLASTERDNAWMARIIARIPPEAVRAIVRQAQVQDPIMERELMRILIGRRKRILKRFFRRLSPLTAPRIEREGDTTRLCMTDLAVIANVIEPLDRFYYFRGWEHTSRSSLKALDLDPPQRTRPDQICIDLPDLKVDAEAKYLIIDLGGLYRLDDEEAMPARVHLYQTGPHDYVIAGMERPYSRSEPGHR